ncbi:unnamed protein product [Leuciscus chuanchicus]
MAVSGKLYPREILVFVSKKTGAERQTDGVSKYPLGLLIELRIICILPGFITLTSAQNSSGSSPDYDLEHYLQADDRILITSHGNESFTLGKLMNGLSPRQREQRSQGRCS